MVPNSINHGRANHERPGCGRVIYGLPAGLRLQSQLVYCAWSMHNIERLKVCFMRVVCWLGSTGLVTAVLMMGSFVCIVDASSLYAAETEAGSTRTRSGLQVLYDFRSADGPLVKDRSGVGDAVDLQIENTKSVRRSAGSLEVRGQTLIRSDRPATKIINAIRRSGEITVEAWIRPAKSNQTGPARIVTLSKNGSERISAT